MVTCELSWLFQFHFRSFDLFVLSLCIVVLLLPFFKKKDNSTNTKWLPIAIERTECTIDTISHLAAAQLSIKPSQRRTISEPININFLTHFHPAQLTHTYWAHGPVFLTASIHPTREKVRGQRAIKTSVNDHERTGSLECTNDVQSHWPCRAGVARAQRAYFCARATDRSPRRVRKRKTEGLS